MGDVMTDGSMRGLVQGALIKTLILGALSTLLASWRWGAHAGWSVVAGLVMVTVNVTAMAWLIRRTLRGPGTGGQGVGPLAALFLLKMLVLLGLTYYVIAVLRLSPLGFVYGYVLFLGALVWQTLVTPPAAEDPEGSADEVPPDL